MYYRLGLASRGGILSNPEGRHIGIAADWQSDVRHTEYCLGTRPDGIIELRLASLGRTARIPAEGKDVAGRRDALSSGEDQ